MKEPHGLTRAERQLWKVFVQADRDSSGSLDQVEFEKALRRARYDFTRAELSDIMSDVDRDRSGQLEWHEFKRVAKRLQMLRLPEAGTLGLLLIFEQCMWGLAGFCFMPAYMYVSPATITTLHY